ncbi:MAG: hypothetical protein ABI175_25995 [Polyangiales bacterium]
MTTRRILALTLLSACGAALRPFPRSEPMRADADMVPFAPKPTKYKSPEIWNTVDNTLFEPLVKVLAVDRVPRALNVNAFDEVPDSSWFTNRIDTLVRDPDAFVRGPCTAPTPDAAGPWTVIGGKPNGANPGFMVKHASGQTFLFKLDGGTQGERASTADVIGSRIYYAAGYNAPCNRIAYIDPATFVLSPKAKAENFVGDEIPFTQQMLEAALAKGIRSPEGRIRGGLSQLLDGKPLGPWKDWGTRADDPNDVIAHEERRELRGSYVFGAWLGHYDAREQNSLDMWIETTGGLGYVKHYMLDFGDCLGSGSAWARVTSRRGHAYELDWPVAFVEIVTLGLLDRPWRDPQESTAGPTLGTFTPEVFTADGYRTAYRYGPYTRVTEADGAWGARILAQISPALIRALVADAYLSDPAVATELERSLLGRRAKLLRRYLTGLSPLARPHIDDHGQLCMVDARRDGGLAVSAVQARVLSPDGTPALSVVTDVVAGETCVDVPVPGGDEVTVVEIQAVGTRPVRVHLYASDAKLRIAGIER